MSAGNNRYFTPDHAGKNIKPGLSILTAVVLCGLFLMFNSGCGIYTFSGNVPGHLKSVAIPAFENQTAEFAVVDLLTDALEEVFRSDNTLKISSIKNSDSVLNGTIIRISDVPSTYNADESVEEYKITVTVLVRFEDQVRNRIVWEETLSGFGIYPFSGGSSAQRDSGLEEAVEKLAEDILNKTVSGW